MILDVLLALVGVAALVAGAEFLVRGASALALRFGLSPLVIGLTVVAFGTSAPELAVSLGAALGGTSDVAIGNVIGSNIFNVLVILGTAALIRAQVVQRRLVRSEVPLMVVVSLVAALMAHTDERIGRVEGLVLVLSGAGFTWWLMRSSRSADDEADAPGTSHAGVLTSLGFVVGGLIGLVAGAQAMVSGATSIARDLGVSELIIGLTVVAIGTSLPELATSLVAARRGQTDIAVGNVVGSNLFNLMIVLGATSAISPVPVVGTAIRIDLLVMVGVAVLCLPVFFTGHRVSRWEGGVFVAAYVGYTTYLILRDSGTAVAADLGTALLVFGLPPIVLTLGILSARQMRDERRTT